MRWNHSDGVDRPAFAAAALGSKRSAERVLMVVLDAANQQIDLKVFEDELVAEGSGACSLRSPDVAAITALARVTARYASPVRHDQSRVEVNVAVTWAVVQGREGPELDVAGTAYVFHPCELRPEEFRARRDPFNTLDSPLLERPERHRPRVDRGRRSNQGIFGRPAPGPVAFPPYGPLPGWAFRCPEAG